MKFSGRSSSETEMRNEVPPPKEPEGRIYSLEAAARELSDLGCPTAHAYRVLETDPSVKSDGRGGLIVPEVALHRVKARISAARSRPR